MFYFGWAVENIDYMGRGEHEMFFFGWAVENIDYIVDMFSRFNELRGDDQSSRRVSYAEPDLLRLPTHRLPGQRLQTDARMLGRGRIGEAHVPTAQSVNRGVDRQIWGPLCRRGRMNSTLWRCRCAWRLCRNVWTADGFSWDSRDSCVHWSAHMCNDQFTSGLIIPHVDDRFTCGLISSHVDWSFHMWIDQFTCEMISSHVNWSFSHVKWSVHMLNWSIYMLIDLCDLTS